ncbi:MAG: NAD(P)H-binding protein [Mariniphaga sp.]|nr:NAD(P)H-binding protein [Mariniphaga sp.]
MLGATGAVGESVVQELKKHSKVNRITLLGRNISPDIKEDYIQQEIIDILDTDFYKAFLQGHQIAICTLGIGEASKAKKEDFIRIDKLAVIDFAKECKKAGIRHFELLGAVGSNANSSSLYFRTKGELVNELKALKFERLSIFQPSLIQTPTNRYGFSQAVALFVFPYLKPILSGRLRKFRGIPVEQLGKAIAVNLFNNNEGFEILHWDEFNNIT